MTRFVNHPFLSKKGLHALIYGAKAFMRENLQGLNLFMWEKDILKYILQIAACLVVLLLAASWSNLAFLNNRMPSFHIYFPLGKVD
jgi:hypothetical protein